MKYLFVSILICLSFTGHAQQNHFIYIQADNKQPFYIRMDKKLLSSSVSGYLIVPKLPDGSYDLSIGFPKNEWPEQKVTCNIDNKDVGYLLKNFGEKGWGLFNLQTMDLVMADTKPVTDSNKLKENKEDLFATTLANVVNDPNIRAVEEEKADTSAVIAPIKKTSIKKAVPVKNKGKDKISKLLSKKNAETVKMVYADRVNGVTDTINIVIPVKKPVAKTIAKDTLALAKIAKPEKHIAVNKKQAKKVPAVKPDTTTAIVTTVVKAEESKTELVQENKNVPGLNDSSLLIQPGKKIEQIIADMAKADSNNIVVVKAEEPKVDLVKEENKKTVPPADTVIYTAPVKQVEIKTVLAKAEPMKETKKDIQSPDTAATKTTASIEIKKTEPVKAPAKTVVVEKPKEEIVVRPVTAAPVYACKYVADGDEFMNLRKKMSKGKSDNEMLFIAHQLFLKRCVNSKQVERLCLLFTNDMAKYNLFDDAYHYTVDLENFPALQSQLTDEYYIKRFKAMLRQ